VYPKSDYVKNMHHITWNFRFIFLKFLENLRKFCIEIKSFPRRLELVIKVTLHPVVTTVHT